MISKIIGLFVIFGICNSQKITHTVIVTNRYKNLGAMPLTSTLPVTVFYESLCPDSQAFITNQLYPTLKNGFEKYVDLKLVPYGKSNHSTLGPDVQFTCHHGPNECFGNKVQSCAIANIQVDSYQKDHTRESLILEYINCLMKMGNNFPDSLYPGKKCAQEVHLTNWDHIEHCANSTEGSKLLEINGVLTQQMQPPLTSVPTIHFAHQYDPELQHLAETTLRTALCKKLPEPKPNECKGSNGGVNEFVASSFVISSALIVSRMF